MEEQIINLLKKYTKLNSITLEHPPDPNLGDYAFPCFSLSKKLKLQPNIIAEKLAKEIVPTKEVTIIEANGPYLNFFINKRLFINKTLKQINKQKTKYGSSNLGKKQRLMIEFSQANTHKAFHVGHLRGTCLGESLARIFECLNYEVIRANYQGDTGAHVAKWIWYYLKYNKGKKPPTTNIDTWIAKIYIDAVKKLSEYPKLQKEVDKINYELENKTNKSLIKTWKDSRGWSLKEFQKIYKELLTHFDVYFFEGQMESAGKDIVKGLLAQKIAEISEGATIINLEKYGLGKWVLLRKDGTCLYSAKDLALAKIKFDKYKIQKSIYVVGAAQTLHLKQLFKTLELLKFKYADLCVHLPFTEVRLPIGKMSSRTGENILYSEMKESLLKNAIEETKKRKNVNKNNIKKTASVISFAAIKYAILSQDPNKPIIFDPKKEIRFEGDTGPYIQYTHARISSIIRKEKQKQIKDCNLTTIEEYNMVNKLYNFPFVVKKAAAEFKPHIIANYLLELSHLINEFYHSYPVLKAPEETKQSRLFLLSAVKIVIKNGLFLLTIDAPESM